MAANTSISQSISYSSGSNVTLASSEAISILDVSFADAVSVGTGNVQLSIAGIVGPCVVAIANTDPVNYVQFGFASGTYNQIIPPNEMIIVKTLAATAFWVSAHTATCVCKVFALQGAATPGILT